MQPVIITKHQFTHSLWWIQIVLLVMVLLIVALSLVMGLMPLALMFLILPAMAWNHSKIMQYQDLKLSFTASGTVQIFASPKDPQAVPSTVQVDGFWHLPQLLMIKLSGLPNKQKLYITVFRAVVGAANYGKLLVYLSVSDPELTENHES